MAQSPLRPHLHPEELARRQRWVAVGVTILTILLLVTWFITLPGRISEASGGNKTGWRSLFGEVPKSSFIDADALINSPARQEQDAKLMQAVIDVTTSSTPEAATQAVATTTEPIATSTPISAPNKNKK